MSRIISHHRVTYCNELLDPSDYLAEFVPDVDLAVTCLESPFSSGFLPKFFDGGAQLRILNRQRQICREYLLLILG